MMINLNEIDESKLKVIGTPGRFTIAYQYNSNQVLLKTRSIDYTKDIYCGLSGIHIPRIEFLFDDPDFPCKWYLADRLYPVASSSGVAFELMNRSIVALQDLDYEYYRTIVNQVQKSNLPIELKTDLLSIIEAHRQLYPDQINIDGECDFNFSIDSTGTLILRDILSPVL